MTGHLAILGTFLAVAAAADVAQRRVPNAVVAPLAAAGLAVQWLEGGAGSAARGLAAGVAVVALFFYPWARGKLGAGDVKLAASTATWVGLDRLVPFLFLAGAAGIVVALAARYAHRLEIMRLARAASASGTSLDEVAPPRETAPLAVAVAIGALVAVRWGTP